MGLVVTLDAAFMLLSALVAIGDRAAFQGLVLSAATTSVLGIFPLIFVRRSGHISSKEGYMIVALAWVVSCFVGMFPYLLCGEGFSVAEAWFESVSGFTTTGATAIHDIEGTSRGLLFWRACTHWVGGMGVVMFALVVLPAMGRARAAVASSELSPLAKDNYRYRTHRIAQIVLGLYVGMTLVAAVALMVAGLGWFDAVVHAFSTVATGGFSTHSASIGYYDSVWVEGITAFFMLLSGVHYGVLFATITGRANNILRSEVARFYLGSTVIVAAAITLSLWLGDVYPSLGTAARAGIFQTVSTITTTGFAIADTTLWGPLAVVLLIWLMFQCGCAGSTSGGVKSDRVWLAAKVFRAQVVQQQHPNAVVRIKLGGVVQETGIVSFTMFFIVLYLLLTALGTVVVASSGVDLTTSFTMIAACMGNAGPGFGTVGSAADYAGVVPWLKVFCTLFMLLGRLEIFGLIQLFVIKWWR